MAQNPLDPKERPHMGFKPTQYDVIPFDTSMLLPQSFVMLPATDWVPPLSHLSSPRSHRTGRWPTHRRTACTSCTSRLLPWVKTARPSWSTTARPTRASAGAASRLLTPPPTSCTGYRRASRWADTSICLFLLLFSWNRLDRSCDTLNIFILR
jgi:hypothetical protein